MYYALIAALHRITAEEVNFNIKRDEDEISVSIDGVGEASGQYAYIDDEDTVMEGFPLGLSSYGDKAAEKILKDIQGISYIFYIESIEIDTSVREKGYGKLLLQKLEEEAQKEKIDAFMGNAAPFGHGAKRVSFSTLKKFYTGQGYKFLHVYDGQNGLILKQV